MKKKAKDNVLAALGFLSKTSKSVSATDIAEYLGISRQNSSHYLSRLSEEGLIKKIDGKPVYWKIINRNNSSQMYFSNIIGFDGSLADVIEQCVSSVLYPGSGLSLLITGATGVGKSYLAMEVYNFAKKKQVLNYDAPFIELNCADYADNPQLVSSLLFGYKKGSYTGAENDTDGLLKKANNGYLFLDEVHRLSKENQEKLFLFMDSGKYRLFGDSSEWLSSKVRLIFATTENIGDYLIETFVRRIDIITHINSYMEKPLKEKMQLIYFFFQQESKVLSREILLEKDALNLLLYQQIKGNIGGLRTLIKTSCASIYSKTDSDILILRKRDLRVVEESFSHIDKLEMVNDIFISSTSNLSDNVMLDLHDIEEDIAKLNCLILQINFELEMLKVTNIVHSIIKKIQNNNSISAIKKVLDISFQQKWEEVIIKKYGIIDSRISAVLCSSVYINLPNINTSVQKSILCLSKTFSRTAYISKKFIEQLEIEDQNQRDFLLLFVLVLLLEVVDENIELKGLLLAHGDSTASSIQSVVNQLCGNYIFEAIDMPIESNVNEIVTLTTLFMKNQVNFSSLVLIVDMGSLNQIYTKIKNDLGGELLLINNLTTSIALDIGLKISQNVSFCKIANDAESNYSINVQYFEGFSQKNNIIISCMSGLGISEKLKQILCKYLNNDNLEIFSKDYKTVKKLIDENDDTYFLKTKLVITTTNLPKSFNIPNINIYDIFDVSEVGKLELIFSDLLSHNDFNDLIQEIIKFFSFEGIENRLLFLNPKVILEEVEVIVSKYENYYNVLFNGRIKLNLYMHIALMIERLLTSKNIVNDQRFCEQTEKEEEFYFVSKSIFQILESKYNFEVNRYEISLLYELICIVI